MSTAALPGSPRTNVGFGVDSLPPTTLLLPPLLATSLLWAAATTSPESLAVAYAFGLLAIPWGSYLAWRQLKNAKIPTFAMISAMYWLFFVVTLFFGERTVMLGKLTPVSEEAVTQATAMALAAVASLWCGMRLPWHVALHRLPYIPLDGRNLTYVRAVLLFGAIATLFPGSVYWLGSDARVIVIDAETAAPLVAFAILLERYWTGKALYFDRVALVAFIGIRTAGSLSAGWLGPMVGVGVTGVGAYIAARRKVPWRYIAITIAAIMFLQVGKTAYRDAFWSQNTDAGVVDKVDFWISTSANQWAGAFSGTSGESRGELAAKSVERASLLGQVAHVLEVTPSQVPFQMGSTYSYMAVTLIPRFLWPDKPSMSDANRFYQLAYGLSDSKTVQATSISIGAMAEAFINFGWYGVIAIMFLIGMLIGFYEHIFFVTETNSYFLACGLVLLPGFLAIESQFAQYFSGVIQQFLITLVMFLPIIKRTPARWSQRGFQGRPAFRR